VRMASASSSTPAGAGAPCVRSAPGSTFIAVPGGLEVAPGSNALAIPVAVAGITARGPASATSPIGLGFMAIFTTGYTTRDASGIRGGRPIKQINALG
jgi:hypothetical protein